ncbi:threonine--tRNA ligase [Candidatus Poribacteria bacterium]|nr:threonine--tRNA ligase [Candidatus Poribacteria bacterium]MBT5533312.1 threonine--tRNA ligase [Candidatus Poribacteria bacterium]MBT7101848.1 threonine--tRNA ligase [Candidatus Poribacteria bacterium]MBT7807908.1 threonine--tRNA ligase [Candidatus Poribacteria bacterium]
MASISVTLPDGSVREIAMGTTALELAGSIGSRLAREALVAEVNGTLTDLTSPLTTDATVTFHTFDSDEGKEVYRHTTAHMLAQAVQRLRPDAKVTIGPAIDDGFYYDFDTEPFVPEDLEAIEAEMRKIAKEDHPTERSEMSRAEVYELFDGMGETYKREILDDIPDEEVLSVYRQGDFTDLCRGPHVPSTRRIKYFKLTSTGGAYWRGNEANKQLQRIYGTAFEKKAQLDEHLTLIEEAERRDHRRLGTQLELYSTHQDLGGGLVLWHPKGALVRHIAEDYWKQTHLAGGYDFVYSPHIGRSKLWETSGHLEFFADSMYAPLDIDGQEYYLKPMNCPFHILIYKNRQHSYRELPMRLAELGTVYRYERAGALHGMMRVRGFTQDDAHIFCRPEQMPDEIDRTLGFCLDMLRAFGFTEFELFLSTRPEKAVGDAQQWLDAQDALRAALERTGIAYEVDEGGGAFYGPKIDLNIRDSLNRRWQCSTIQFDFNLPERFDITYIGEDGQQHRPYMVHRALFGSVERFFGVLIEHYAGAFPVWLAPVQAVVLSITDDHREYAEQVRQELADAGIRVEADVRGEKLGYKVREAELAKTPYMLVVGAREIENEQVAVRTRQGNNLGAMPVAAFIERIQEDIGSKV